MLEAVIAGQIYSVSCDLFPEDHEYKVTYNLRCKFFEMGERKEKCEKRGERKSRLRLRHVGHVFSRPLRILS